MTAAEKSEQQRLDKQTSIGTLHDKDSLFMRYYVGEAKEKNGNEYEMSCQGIGPGAPIIRNKQTGRWFTLSWEDIINLAKQAGIDKE